MRLKSSLRKLLLDIPAPVNLSIWWNFGSLLGLVLSIQIVSGVILSFHYVASADTAFKSIIHIIRDVPSGWLFRSIHMNGASMFFFLMYIHIGRGLYYGSYRLAATWLVGSTLLLLSMATAFLGYVLPWGQMSFWGASVITNLLTAVPYVGGTLVEWVWGGPSLNSATLTRFYSLHFLLPFMIAGMSAVHLLFLHQTGSSNPLGLNSDAEKIPFHPYYTWKDLVGFFSFLIPFSIIVFFYPNMFTDPANWMEANPRVTPPHIQPEWYFLFAYAILRSIPNKLGGVLALVMSVGVLYLLPYLKMPLKAPLSYYPISQSYFWFFLGVFLILTWIGACPVEYPYIQLGQIFTVLYFSYFFVSPLLMFAWDQWFYFKSAADLHAEWMESEGLSYTEEELLGKYMNRFY